MIDGGLAMHRRPVPQCIAAALLPGAGWAEPEQFEGLGLQWRGTDDHDHPKSSSLQCPPVMKTAPITKVTDQDGARLAKLLPRKGYEVHDIKHRAGLINTYRVEHL